MASALLLGSAGLGNLQADAAKEPVVFTNTNVEVNSIVSWATGYRDYKPNTAEGNVLESYRTPENAVGPYSSSLVVLGDNGEITMEFEGIGDGPGQDFAVFENGFATGPDNTLGFLELAYVQVSSNGTDWVQFDSSALRNTKVGSYEGVDPSQYNGLAGKALGGFGTGFDLAALKDKEEVAAGLVKLNDIKYVKIIDIKGDGTNKDSYGRPIYDPDPSGGSAGFDLRAVGVINKNYAVTPPFNKGLEFDLDAEITQAVAGYSQQVYDDWASVASNLTGLAPDPDYIAAYTKQVIDAAGVYKKGTDIAKVIIGLTAADVNIKDIGGINLLDKAVNFDPARLTVSNDVVYMLLALDSGRYEIPEGSKVTREFLVDKLLSLKIKGGGWSFFGSTPDPDMSGIIMAGLAPYYDTNPQVKAAIDETAAYWKGKQITNSNSLGQLILGLAANEIDPAGEDYKQGDKNMLNDLYTYKAADGLYKWRKADAKSNVMAQRDVMAALNSYKRFLNGSDFSIYYNLKPTPVVEEPGTPTDPEPGTPTDPQPGTPTDPQPGTPTDPQPGTPTDPQPGTPTDPEPGTPTDPQPGTPTDPQPGTPPVVVPPTVSPAEPPPAAATINVPVTITSDVPYAGLPKSGTVSIKDGATAYQALLALAGSSNVKATGSGQGLYVQAIYELEEFDYGPLSGWTYYVNGVMPDYSADVAILHSGDTLSWKYVGDANLAKPTPAPAVTSPTGTVATAAPGPTPKPAEQPAATAAPAAPVSQVTFTDAAAISSFAADSVKKAQELGIMTGKKKADGSFSFEPKAPITRAEFTTVLVRLLYGEQTAGTAVIKDVSSTNWAYPYIAKAKEQGIINGFQDGSFRPGDPVTREQAAVIVQKAFNITKGSNPLTFSDISSDRYSFTAIEAVSSNGFIVGSDSSFNPADKVTREMAATIMIRLYDNYLAK
ncbi:S-layer homology domain-containing protein [Paenibacillus sp. PK3_47]|uniref:S-layer homology domain-containing protein n=1 Tax=Paenibacillus sp. PK3_47 TaxID=2072642 RepID=UPI00201DD696|nr:S-layer homology domain-containing protein [Paenibacillus sp. PK3_47]